MQQVPATLDSLRFTVSGAGELWSVAPDEAFILRNYQAVRDAGRGSLYVEFNDGRAIKYDVKHSGDVGLLNSLLPRKQLRD